MIDKRFFRAYSNHQTCRIVVDSCSDITCEIAQKLGVDIIEFPYVLDGKDCIDDQFESVSSQEFYGLMRNGAKVLTSAIPTGHFVEIFNSMAEAGIPTLYLSFTAGLSRSVDDALKAAAIVREDHPGFEIEVLDNRLPSLSALLLAMEACALRDRGLTMREIAQWAQTAPNYVHGYFTLDSLNWLAAGGRVPKSAAKLSTLLDMKANLAFDLDGALTLTGMSRGRRKSLKNLAATLENNYDASRHGPIAIVDAGCADDADYLEEMIRAELKDTCPQIVRLILDPTIGAHVGPGMVAISFWGIDRALIQLGKR